MNDQRRSLLFLTLTLAPGLCAAQADPLGFGASVSSADVNSDGFSDLLVGDPGHGGSRPEQGRVLLYLGSSAGPAGVPDWSVSGGQELAHVGASLAGAGDLNGDGFDDVVVGVPDLDVAIPARTVGGAGRIAVDAGGFAIFLGSAAGLAQAPVLVRRGRQAGERLGATLACGDLNGDGFGDLAVGAPGSGDSPGSVRAYLGSAVRLTLSWMEIGPATGARFGAALACDGDANGDGFDDLLVGAPEDGAERSGSAYAYLGSATGPSRLANWTLGYPAGQSPGAWNDGNSDWGFSLAWIDLNGDGYSEALIGNPNFNGIGAHASGPLIDSGDTQIFAGTSAGPGALVQELFGGSSLGNFERLGLSLVNLGDTNGDGRNEGALSREDPNAGLPSFFNFEAVYVLRGAAAPLYTSLVRNTPSRSLVSADVDGDGFADLVVGGAEIVTTLLQETPSVKIYPGSASGLASTPAWTLLEP